MSGSRPPRPPRLAEWLLRRSLPVGTRGDSILGDAREEYTARVRSGRGFPRLWYCLHALALARAYTGEAVMDALFKDLRLAARSLARQPGSAVLSVLILGLGIGLSTFMFSLVYGVLLRGLDVPEAHRIAVLQGVDVSEAEAGSVAISGHDFLDFRERLRTFEGLAAYDGGTMNVADDTGPAERVQGVTVTVDVFDVLRVRPRLGRTFAEGEDRPGLPPTVVLGYAVWRDRYGADPGILGRSIRVNGESATVVGVMPQGFRWPSRHDLWITTNDDVRATARGEGPRYAVIGRLAGGVSWEEAEQDVARVAAQLEREHPELNEGITARLLTVSQQQNGEDLAMLFTAMMVAVLCVLLVACANVANLLLVRAATRAREAGVRVALGGSRLRVMAPFLAEALVLAVAGAALGAGLAYQAVAVFDRATATPLTGRPYFMTFEVDLPVLLYMAGVTILTALVAGVFPALQVSRTDVGRVLKDDSRGTSSLRLGRLSRVLVVGEVSLSVALLVGAGLMVKSMVLLDRYDLPFDPEAYVTGQVGLVEADYAERVDRQAFWREMERRVRAAPGVAVAALTSAEPGTGTPTTRIRLEGRGYDDPGERPSTHYEIVSPGYFEVLGAGFLEGEGFNAGHTRDVERVAVVNRSFARRFWPDGSAVGRRFRTGTADSIPWMTVIGVVPDLHMEGFQPTGSPIAEPDGFYVPVYQSDASFLGVVARARSGGPEDLVPALREAVRAIDPDIPLFGARSLDEAIHRSSWFYSVFGSVFVVFGVAALFMATAGLYGVLSFSVSRRTREMGLRMALGAGARQVTRLILRQGAKQIALGLVLGLAMAAGVSNVVEALMFQVDPRDPTVFGGVAAVIVAVGLLASLVPAQRATRVDPMVALRSE